MKTKTFLIVITLSLLTVGCVQLNSAPEAVVIPSAEQPTKGQISDGGVQKCARWAASVIPNEITFIKYSSDFPYSHWNDDTVIETSSPYIIFEQGSEAGQNINNYYLYMDAPSHGVATLIYRRNAIDSIGNILGENYFEIRPVARIVPGSEDRTANNQPTRRMEIIDYALISCRKFN